MGKIDILSASAGSGKTYRLALNYIKTLLEEPYNYRHILAVTFTNKATDELKERILTQLNALASGQESDFDEDLRTQNYDPEVVKANATKARNLILHDYNNFAVMTIDKFFQRVMRAFIKEIGVELNFNLELKTDSLLEQAADLMLEQVTQDKLLYDWIMAYIGEKIDDNKAWNIKREIISLGKQLFNEEYRHDSIDSSSKPELTRILQAAHAKAAVLTKAYQAEAQKFVALMDTHAIKAENFKGGARNGLGNYIQKVASGMIVPPSKAAIKAVEQGEWHKIGSSPAFDTIDSLEGDFSAIITNLIELYPKTASAENTRKILATNYREFALLADLRTCINDICKKEDILPIADVGEIISHLVADNDAPFIYEKAGNRFDYFMIDEFQDTSTMQWRNFVPLLHNALSQSVGSPILLVGDVKQSIYRWRGGDWSLLAKGVSEEFGEVNTEPLDMNRRSTRNVVKFNNHLTQCAVEYISERLKSELSEAQAGGHITAKLAKQLTDTVSEAYSQYEQKQKPDAKEGYVTVLAYDKEDSPHPAIARIEELQERGFRASDIAVLVRTNREARQIAAQILEYKNNPERNPKYIFDVVTQEALAIGSSRGVQFIIACMSICTSPEDTLSRAIYNEYLGRPISEEFSAEEESFISSLSLLQPEEIFNEILLHFPMLSQVGEIPYIQALHSQIINYCSKNVSDTALFLKWWGEVGSGESVSLPQDADAITIITIHKSKGLGFNAVIIPYCNWSLKPMTGSTIWAKPNQPLSDQIVKFPAGFSSDMGTSEFSHSYFSELTMSAVDALNALYVAITRAKQELHIMVPTNSSSSSVGAIVKGMAGVSEENPIYALGEAAPYKSKEHSLPSLSTFDTHSPSQKVAVRYSHQRYDSESKGEHIGPRDFGILMHQAMEKAGSMEEIASQIEGLVNSRLITSEEAHTLKEQITEAIESYGIGEWFDGSWESIRSEQEIIGLGGKVWRPDRIMIKGDEVVVVDYKFGMRREESHREQVESYAALLKSMGYSSVRGYLWYITLGDVEQVV